MKRAALLAGLAVAVGFGVGLLWGKQTRSRLGEAVQTSFDGGKLTVQVDAYKAGREGLADVIMAKWGDK